MGEQSEVYLQRRQLVERVLDRIAKDPDFRQRLLDDPQAALRGAGFTQEIEALLARGEAPAHALSPGDESRSTPSLPNILDEDTSKLSTQLLFAAFAGMLRPAQSTSTPDIDRSKVIDYTRTKEMA